MNREGKYLKIQEYEQISMNKVIPEGSASELCLCVFSMAYIWWTFFF